MTAGKSVLIIGFEPTLLAIPDLDAAKVTAALKADEARLRGLGYEVELCLIDLGKTAETVVLDRLKQKQFNCILIGAGVRTIPEYFILFEKLINVSMLLKPSCVSTRSQGTRLRQSSVGSDVPMVVVVRKAQRPNQLLHANRRRAS